ncbi:efflux RND transporter periplasmic adaptor subunit [Yeosuana sp. MJ-SS3]|uniref:Efflux RND transporter periplasmic adaptor subunit n=1 Tax=Gilvirhabdus luticola TaxID=3079858 RepID=A0ABU3UA40_9FLAO|nr:efflux RND transporter periplasmic adaptor subunit [Yeosuana sp. MJ-SS3]MDU8887217.1 efflux RND transporter periplasmic adaptor subunit [Yeosuana sp. MJ-SS3]
MKNYTYLLIAVLISTLMLSCGKNDQKEIEQEIAIPVKVNEVGTNENDTFLSISGKIQAENSADLSTRTMGFVNSVPVNVGDKVSKGQLLISINNTDLQAKKAQVDAGIAEAQVAYNNAEKDYNRFKNLFSENSASQKELDDMTARFEMAKARLESAKQMKNEVNAQFAYTNIIAPFNGMITNKMVEKGDMANPGQSLISIESPGNFEVVGSVPELEISQIKKGTKVKVIVKSINKTITGQISEVSASAKNTGGQYFVKVSLDKTEVNILSGMFATILFPVEKAGNISVVLVPSKALITNGQLTGIYTVSQSNTAILRWLRLGRTYGDQVEVLSGLSVGETYIVSAKSKLYNGAKIKIQ